MVYFDSLWEIGSGSRKWATASALNCLLTGSGVHQFTNFLCRRSDREDEFKVVYLHYRKSKRGLSMVKNYDTLLREALNLSSSDKIHLLSDLFKHIMNVQQREREQLWATEAGRRLEEYDKGNIKSEDWERGAQTWSI